MTAADAAVIAVYVVALFLPGGVLGLLAGLRGWTLAATAPLLTYAVAGLAGPLYSAAGVGWTPASAAAGVAAVWLVAGVARLVVRLRGRERVRFALPAWSRTAQAGVVACTVLAAAVGVAVILGGIRQLGAIPQDWDAVFHANGIRLIADTGDGGLYAMARTNWYEGDVTVFYPNAYHLVAATVYQLTGATVPTVLNAHTVLVPGLLALSLAAMVRRFGGRPLLAAATALAAVSVTSVYDLLWRGPLLPFATGVALTPVLVVLVLDVVDAPRLRAALAPGALFALGMAGMLCLHPAILIGAILFTVPALLQRWIGRPRAIPREIAVLVVPGVVAALLCGLQLAGTLSSGGNLETISWPADLTVTQSVTQLVSFGHSIDTAQRRLALVMLLGLLAFWRLRSLRWVVATAAIFGALFVIAASVEAPWAKLVTSLWWNDRWRLVALAALPMCVLVGHGVAELQRWAAIALRSVAAALPSGDAGDRFARLVRPTAAFALLSSLLLVLLFGLGTRGLYLARDQERMTNNSGDGPAVSQLEIEGMQAVARIVPPGERVLNDRGDGSVWMYALTGVRPVAAHYDAARTGPDAGLLAARFNRYPDEPDVRAAVARLDVRYVQLDAGFLRGYAVREPGLADLGGQPWLTEVYRNPDVVLYEITPAAAADAPVVPVLAEAPR